MRAKWPLMTVLLTMSAGYVAYPYLTLYRLGEAIRHGDATTLETLVNWPSVREGIKEDICDFGLDQPAGGKDGAELPAFGASFVRGIAANAIDRAVTPEALVKVAGHSVSTGTPARIGADVHVNWAFFDDPTAFSVSLRTPEQAEPIRLRMELRQGKWQVRRVWLPPTLLGSANPRA